MNQYKRIIVAVDGSKEAEYAFIKSIDVAKRNKNACLSIVTIIDTGAYDRSIFEHAQQRSEEFLHRYKAQAEAEDVKNVKIVIEYAPPKISLQKIATQVAADLIICGATGINAVERFLIGSVSEAIVRSANCDVLIVRKPILHAVQ